MSMGLLFKIDNKQFYVNLEIPCNTYLPVPYFKLGLRRIFFTFPSRRRHSLRLISAVAHIARISIKDLCVFPVMMICFRRMFSIHGEESRIIMTKTSDLGGRKLCIIAIYPE